MYQVDITCQRVCFFLFFLQTKFGPTFIKKLKKNCYPLIIFDKITGGKKTKKLSTAIFYFIYYFFVRIFVIANPHIC